MLIHFTNLSTFTASTFNPVLRVFSFTSLFDYNHQRSLRLAGAVLYLLPSISLIFSWRDGHHLCCIVWCSKSFDGSNTGVFSSRVIQIPAFYYLFTRHLLWHFWTLCSSLSSVSRFMTFACNRQCDITTSCHLYGLTLILLINHQQRLNCCLYQWCSSFVWHFITKRTSCVAIVIQLWSPVDVTGAGSWRRCFVAFLPLFLLCFHLTPVARHVPLSVHAACDVGAGVSSI